MPCHMAGLLQASGDEGAQGKDGGVWKDPAVAGHPGLCSVSMGERTPHHGLQVGLKPVPSGALHLQLVPLAQDVLQQPIDHIQSLVLLQHDVIGVHVALPPLLHLVIQEANLENVLHTRNPIGHGEVPNGVSQQDDIGFALKLLEVTRVLTHGAVLVVCVYELALKSLEKTLSIALDSLTTWAI